MSHRTRTGLHASGNRHCRYLISERRPCRGSKHLLRGLNPPSLLSLSVPLSFTITVVVLIISTDMSCCEAKFTRFWLSVVKWSLSREVQIEECELHHFLLFTPLLVSTVESPGAINRTVSCIATEIHNLLQISVLKEMVEAPVYYPVPLVSQYKQAYGAVVRIRIKCELGHGFESWRSHFGSVLFSPSLLKVRI